MYISADSAVSWRGLSSKSLGVEKRWSRRHSPALPLDQHLCVVNPVVRHGEHGKGEDRQGDEESSELHGRRWGERMLRWLTSGMLRGCGLYDLTLGYVRGEEDDKRMRAVCKLKRLKWRWRTRMISWLRRFASEVGAEMDDESFGSRYVGVCGETRGTRGLRR